MKFPLFIRVLFKILPNLPSFSKKHYEKKNKGIAIRIYIKSCENLVGLVGLVGVFLIL